MGVLVFIGGGLCLFHLTIGTLFLSNADVAAAAHITALDVPPRTKESKHETKQVFGIAKINDFSDISSVIKYL